MAPDASRPESASSSGASADRGRAAPGVSPEAPPRAWWRSVTARVLAVNLLAIASLAGGLLYLDRYRSNLIDSQLESLAVQGGIFAAAIGEAAVTSSPAAGQDFLTALARPMVRRLAVPAQLRARLFAANGDLVADSRHLGAGAGEVQISALPPPPERSGLLGHVVDVYEWVVRQLPARNDYPPYREHAQPRAEHYQEAQKALAGETARAVRARPDGSLVLSVAVPVQRYKQVLGALMLTTGSREIEANVRSVRLDILKVFAVVLIFTVLVSLWLAGTIARPVSHLARAAERVRARQGQEASIPDYSGRGDEIGDLSAALRDMTRALTARLNAIERFAADVAHEIKNPLSSLRSAVETAARLDDPEQQRRLMAIVLDDVQRLDRLITDISDASRLDAELGRERMQCVEMRGLLEALVEVETATVEGRGGRPPRLVLDLPEGESLAVRGMEDRLAQVFRNLIANAVSFSPPDAAIRLTGERTDGEIRVAVEDEGPGLPEDKLEAIFDRFYSERPEGEKFGTHSGLGLSISKQIIEAHGGCIRAENVRRNGRVGGARFVVTLRAAGDD